MSLQLSYMIQELLLGVVIVQPAEAGAPSNRGVYFPALLSRFDGSFRAPRAFFSSRSDEAVLRGFFAVEDSAAGAADGHAVLDLFRADGALRQRLGIVKPRLFPTQLPPGAALYVRDEP